MTFLPLLLDIADLACPLLLLIGIIMIANIKAYLVRFDAVFAVLQALIVAKDAEIAALKAEVEALRADLAELPTVEAAMLTSVTAFEGLVPAA